MLARWCSQYNEQGQRFSSEQRLIDILTYFIEPANALRLSIVFEDFSLIVILSRSKLLQSLISACTSKLNERKF